MCSDTGPCHSSGTAVCASPVFLPHPGARVLPVRPIMAAARLCVRVGALCLCGRLWSGCAGSEVGAGGWPWPSEPPCGLRRAWVLRALFAIHTKTWPQCPFRPPQLTAPGLLTVSPAPPHHSRPPHVPPAPRPAHKVGLVFLRFPPLARGLEWISVHVRVCSVNWVTYGWGASLPVHCSRGRGHVSMETRSRSAGCCLIGMHPQCRFIVLALMTGLSCNKDGALEKFAALVYFSLAENYLGP